MTEFELMDKDFSLDGRHVLFERSDGTIAERAAAFGEDADGNMMFWEIADKSGILREKINGREKYCRVAIRRVWPVIAAER